MSETGQDNRASTGGFRSQPLMLKLLLLVSLVLVTVGVVRCSLEATQELPPVTSIGIAPVEVSAADERLPAPADSVAAIARRVFRRDMRSAVEVDVSFAEARSLEVDALVTIRITAPDEALHLEGVVEDRRVSRVVATVESEGPPRALYGLLDILARRTVDELKVGGGHVD